MDNNQFKKVLECKSKEDLAKLLENDEFIKNAKILSVNEKDGSHISVSLEELIDKVGKEKVIQALIDTIQEFKIVPIQREEAEKVFNKIKNGESLTEKEIEIKNVMGIDNDIQRAEESQGFVHEIIATLSKSGVGFDSVGDVAVLALNILTYVVAQGPKISQIENGKSISKIGDSIADHMLSTWKKTLVSEDAFSNDMIILGCIHVIGNIICSESGKGMVDIPFDPEDYCDFHSVDFNNVMNSVGKLPRFQNKDKKDLDGFANFLNSMSKDDNDLRNQLKN